MPPSIPAWQLSSVNPGADQEEPKEDMLEELGSGSGSSEPEHGMKTSESSLEIMWVADCFFNFWFFPDRATLKVLYISQIGKHLRSISAKITIVFSLNSNTLIIQLFDLNNNMFTTE